MPSNIQKNCLTHKEPCRKHTEFFLTIRNSFKEINDKTNIMSHLEQGKEIDLKKFYQDLVFIEKIVKEKISFLIEMDNKLSISVFSDENKEEEVFIQKINETHNDIKSFEAIILKIKKDYCFGKLNIISNNISISMGTKMVFLASKHSYIHQKYKKRIEERFSNDFKNSENIFSSINEDQLTQSLLKEKRNSIIKIKENIMEVNSTIQNIQNLIDFQNENIVLIESNIEETKKNIASGYDEVLKIKKEYEKKNKNILIIFILGAFLIFLVILCKK